MPAQLAFPGEGRHPAGLAGLDSLAAGSGACAAGCRPLPSELGGRPTAVTGGPWKTLRIGMLRASGCSCTDLQKTASEVKHQQIEGKPAL